MGLAQSAIVWCGSYSERVSTSTENLDGPLERLQRTAPDDALVIVEKPATQIKFPAAPAQGSLF
ncbi:hypothetical protein BQ8482_330209 [Mesorhizobium delmotii]|uniref:Uncharacterized protein n=1 Tax=Mesorhizobium delmotii TaxID=1631247 RepID=A0A2P9APJ2_9HYPH|nr:hypothetical protein BQ8482_330209 [Mesorhizobium delmotii]